MNNNKTWIILSPGFPANENDHNCLTFPQAFIRNLKQLNPDLNIIVLAFQYPFSTIEYEWHEIKVYPFNGRDKGKISRLLVWKSVWSKLKKIVDENNVTGILSLWLGECALIGKYAAKKYGIKNFTWMLGQDAKKNNRYYILARPDPATLIALSDFVSGEFYRNYRVRPLHTIPAGIDRTMFNALPQIRSIDIMGAGSLIPLKQYGIFIRLVAKLIKIKKDLRAIICGEGSERESLQQMIDESNLAEHIHLRGEVPHQQVLSLMQGARIFLHPSSYEGFSTVCSEAMYAGAHVVAFCKPMTKPFEHLHIANTEADMMQILESLLVHTNLDHAPVLTYPIEEVCNKILSLYD